MRRVTQAGLALALLACASPAPAAGAPPPGYRLVFEDAFGKLDLWTGRSGTWEPRYVHGGRTDPTSHEIEYYVDPRAGGDPAGVQEQQPFELDADGLTIAARPAPDDMRRLILGQSYTSGFLNSFHAFSFTYGYVEIRAALPEGKGLWPAFWMLPTTGGWPPEIDILEAIGGEKDQYWATVHTGPEKDGGVQQSRIDAPRLRDGFHDFGLLWTADTIAWFFDGRQAAAIATPAMLKDQAMFLILCMAIGGNWAGPPDRLTPVPARLRIARVRVFQAATPATGAGREPSRPPPASPK